MNAQMGGLTMLKKWSFQQSERNCIKAKERRILYRSNLILEQAFKVEITAETRS